MQDAQFVFVTEDARVMVKLIDGRLEDLTENRDLLPKLGAKLTTSELEEKRRALKAKFAA